MNAKLFTGKKVLVVDDNPVILKALSSMLTSNGFAAILAEEGSRVISCVREQKPDLILLDIVFPPEVAGGGALWDGLRILEWLRTMGEAGNVPVFIISGAGVDQYKDRCLAAGAKAFFAKPIPMKELLAAIRAILKVSPLPLPVPMAKAV